MNDNSKLNSTLTNKHVYLLLLLKQALKFDIQLIGIWHNNEDVSGYAAHVVREVGRQMCPHKYFYTLSSYLYWPYHAICKFFETLLIKVKLIKV